MKTSSILTVLTAIPAVLAGFEDDCTALATSFTYADTDVILADYVPNGTNLTFPESASNTCLKFVVTTADSCRLRLNHTTSTTSSVIVEVFLPKNWEARGKRFLMIGNGGLGGCVQYMDAMYGLKQGFAAVGHNNGHFGDTALPFLNRPEVFKDFVWRAMYQAGKVGKAVVNAFYTSAPSKSYYMGCSTGGRQGWKAAQDFPGEYDGIISAAPAIHAIAGYGSLAKNYLTVGPPGSPTNLNLDQWNRVHQMVRDQCDMIDGVLDGVLEDPMKCQPRPEALLCGPGETWATHQCLTAPQVQSVRTIYEPFYGSDGKLLLPRLNPLTRESLGWAVSYGGTPSYFAQELYAYAIFNDPSWSISTNWSLASVDYHFAHDPENYNTMKTDLSWQQGNSTKMLMYHGLSDGLISSEGSIKYYNDVSRDMGLPSGELDDFFRFFQIPGLDHCYGGDGVWHVNGPTQYKIAGAMDLDPADSVLMTMVKWVEEGVAPETLKGRKLVDGAVVAEKNHCKYPKQSKYKGEGDPNLASSWECSSEQV